MNNTVILNIGRFIGLSILQFGFFNYINLFGYGFPSVFVLFILLLPNSISAIQLMGLAVLAGFVQDLFNGTMGINMFCCVWLAFSRPIILRLITDKKMDKGFELSINEQGFRWFLLYMSLSFFLYHFSYFLIEIWTFQNIIYILAKTIVSSILSVVFSFVIIYLLNRRKERRY